MKVDRTQKKRKIFYSKYKNEVLELIKDGEYSRLNYAGFLRSELGVEGFFQLPGQVI